ncbi:MAG TPA: transposase [Bacteroidia bacterium]|jgi:putative transposase|nr:transposase [Bacteroidia bacterium]
MQLTEKHIINNRHQFYKELDGTCFLSKNLYNKANWYIRQTFIFTSRLKEEGKIKHAIWIRYGEIQKMLQDKKEEDYYALPTKVAQQVLKLLDKNWKSFFEAIKDYAKNPSNYTGRPKLPKYKNKKDGRNILVYTIQSISKTEIKKGIVKLSGTDIRIKTKQTKINQVRVIPQNSQYTIEVIYTKKEVKLKKINKTKKKKVGGIDIGLNNLATVTSNQNLKPLLINGRPLKSMNQYYNKKKAVLQSYVGDKGISKKLICLTNKRNNKINDFMHRASTYVANYFIENKFDVVVIGKNKQWKTEINIGSKNNQNFVSIPHAKFIEMTIYKLKLAGIPVIIREESHTSKCSFIDEEEIKHHENYLGKRKHRGLFISKNGIKINADCNGSGNIIRKEFPNAFADGIQGVVVRPLRVNVGNNMKLHKLVA